MVEALGWQSTPCCSSISMVATSTCSISTVNTSHLSTKNIDILLPNYNKRIYLQKLLTIKKPKKNIINLIKIEPFHKFTKGSTIIPRWSFTTLFKLLCCNSPSSVHHIHQSFLQFHHQNHHHHLETHVYLQCPPLPSYIMQYSTNISTPREYGFCLQPR